MIVSTVNHGNTRLAIHEMIENKIAFGNAGASRASSTSGMIMVTAAPG
jgi:hypothetical protein